MLKAPEAVHATLDAVYDADSPEAHARAMATLLDALADNAHKGATLCDMAHGEGSGTVWSKRARAITAWANKMAEKAYTPMEAR